MHTGVEGEALQSFLPTIKGIDEEGDEESVPMCDGGGPMALQVKVDIPKPVVEGMPPEPETRQQAMNSPEWEEWRKAKEVEMYGMVKICVYKQVARPKDKLAVGTKLL